MTGSVVSSSLFSTLSQTDPLSLIGIGIMMLTFLWLACLVWVLKDSMARSNNILFHVLAVLLITAFTPLFGVPLYLAIRPLYYQPRKYFGRHMLKTMTIPCPSCNTYNPHDYFHCYTCGSDLTVQCASCETFFPYTHEHCFHCGAAHPDSEEQDTDI